MNAAGLTRRSAAAIRFSFLRPRSNRVLPGSVFHWSPETSLQELFNVDANGDSGPVIFQSLCGITLKTSSNAVRSRTRTLKRFAAKAKSTPKPWSGAMAWPIGGRCARLRPVPQMDEPFLIPDRLERASRHFAHQAEDVRAAALRECGLRL